MFGVNSNHTKWRVRMAEAIQATDFHLPGQVGEVIPGKVGDQYTIEHDLGTLLVVVRTDRISAFDQNLPKAIPHKGQVLNEMSAEFLAETSAIAPNWLLDAPDPNVTIGLKADPVKVELIMRSHLLGTAWRKYSQEGLRQICDNTLPDGMEEFEPFDSPLFTPTTKAAHGDTDVDITYKEIIERGLATPDEYEEMVEIASDLFATGQESAEENNLVMPDTKYEAGRRLSRRATGLLVTSGIIVIDEVHTPDSSRFFPLQEYTDYLRGSSDKRPEQLSKEFVREWLSARGFNKIGDPMPEIPDEFVDEVSAKYINLYERRMGREFVPADDSDPLGRIEANVIDSLARLAA